MEGATGIVDLAMAGNMPGFLLSAPNEKAAGFRADRPTLARFFRRCQSKVRGWKFGSLVGLSGKPLTHIHTRRAEKRGARPHYIHHGPTGLQLDRLPGKEFLVCHFCSFAVAVAAGGGGGNLSNNIRHSWSKSEGKTKNRIYF